MSKDTFSKQIHCDISAPVDIDAHAWFRGTEITIETASGSPLVVSVSCSAVLTGNEKLFMLIIRDMTEHISLEREKQEMQRQLFQTSKLASIGELSAGVAHEINNPLNAVVNFAQLLKDDGVARNETEQQMLDGIIEEGRSHCQDSSRFADLRPPGPTYACPGNNSRSYKEFSVAFRAST